MRALLAENRQRGDELVAVGYVFEFGRGQLEFNLCANTSVNLKRVLGALPANSPAESLDNARWNSGNFDYPAAISDRFGGFSDEWWDVLTTLDQLAEAENNRQMVYDGTVEICCESLADLARRSVIENWQQLDLNVADLLDEIDCVMNRDKYIRSLIQTVA